MSTTSTTGPTAFDRVTTVIGHLDHPLYDDEHQRDVWNEASAVGFQAFSWAMLGFLAIAAWAGGPAAAPYIGAVAVILGVVTMIVTTLAQRQGVGPWKVPGTGRARYGVVGVLLLVMIGGVTANSPVGFDVSTVAGALVGAAVGGGAVLLLMLASLRVARRRVPRGED